MKNYRSYFGIILAGLLACACNETDLITDQNTDTDACTTAADCSKAECANADICKSTPKCETSADCSKAECANANICKTSEECKTTDDCSKTECANADICKTAEECKTADDCSKAECANADICKTTEECKTADDCSKAECKDAEICKATEECKTTDDCSKAECKDAEICKSTVTCATEDDCSKAECKDAEICKSTVTCATEADCTKPECAEAAICQSTVTCATEADCSKAECAEAAICQTTAATPTWCKVTYVKTPALTGSTFKAYSQVFADGSTGASGSHDGLVAQMGYVPIDTGSTAESIMSSIVWTNATYNALFDGDGSDNNDEYMSTDVEITSAGTYAVVYRYSADDGKSDAEKEWLYCNNAGVMDLSVSINVSDIQMVNAVDASAPDWCQVTYVKETITVDDSMEAYSQVHASNITGNDGVHEGLKAQFGYIGGWKVSSDPVAAFENVEWSDAKLNDKFNGEGSDNNDEYMSTDVKTDTAGMYLAFYRYSIDNGKSWLYCRKDGVFDPKDLTKDDYADPNKTHRIMVDPGVE